MTLDRSGRINPVSDARRERDRNYQRQRQRAYRRAGGHCEARWALRCTGKADQTHHIAGRGGDDPHRLSNLLIVCHICHDAIHARPADAREVGLLESRLGEVSTPEDYGGDAA